MASMLLAAVLLNQPASPPALELSARGPPRPSPVYGIGSGNCGDFLVGEGVRLRKASGSKLGNDCCRRWEWEGV